MWFDEAAAHGLPGIERPKGVLQFPLRDLMDSFGSLVRISQISFHCEVLTEFVQFKVTRLQHAV